MYKGILCILFYCTNPNTVLMCASNSQLCHALYTGLCVIDSKTEKQSTKREREREREREKGMNDNNVYLIQWA